MRNVIVTGGSRGLGLGLARRLTRAGYRVIAIARKETNQLTLAMEEAERAHPGSFHFVPFDLAETAAIAALVKSLRNAHGPIYGLVNNAAVGFDGVLALMPNAQIEQLVRMNTLSLAREVGRMGVTVNSIAPGFLDTDMTHGLDDEHRQQIVRRSALRRLPEVDDVAAAVEFLLGDAAKSITGTVLTVDAGNTA